VFYFQTMDNRYLTPPMPRGWRPQSDSLPRAHDSSPGPLIRSPDVANLTGAIVVTRLLLFGSKSYLGGVSCNWETE